MFFEIRNKQPVALGNPEEDEKQTKVTGLVQDTDDIGSIMLFASDNIPASYLICNGQALSKEDYPELYSVIGGVFGETADTFNLPDLREVAVAGVSADYTLGTYKKDMFKSHTHAQCSHTHSTSAHTHSNTHVHCVGLDHVHCVPGSIPFCYCGGWKQNSGNNAASYYTGLCVYSTCVYACYGSVNTGTSMAGVSLSTLGATYTSNTGSSDGITRGKRIGMHYIIKARST